MDFQFKSSYSKSLQTTAQSCTVLTVDGGGERKGTYLKYVFVKSYDCSGKGPQKLHDF